MTHTISTAPPLAEVGPTIDFSELGSGPRVLLAYEDFAMGLRGMDVFASIARDAGVAAEAEISPWRLDSLECPEWRETATTHAEKADIVIMALRRDRSLPVQVASWIEQWSRHRKSHDGALVAIFGSDTSWEASNSEVAVHLQAVAETAGMDFFCGMPTQAETGLGLTVPTSLAHDTPSDNDWVNAGDWMGCRVFPVVMGVENVEK